MASRAPPWPRPLSPPCSGAVDEPTFQHILELAPSRLHLNFLRPVSERLRNVNSHFISEVMRTERLSLVGAMANSIIHDLKNPICIIRCCTDLIARESNDPRLLDLTSMADKAVDGMLAMTQELLDYARGSTSLSCETVSIWRLLDELNQQALRLLPGHNIQFAKNIRYDGNVIVDRHPIRSRALQPDQERAGSDAEWRHSHHQHRPDRQSGRHSNL